MTDSPRSLAAAERELQAIRDWRRIGLALLAGCAVVEQMALEKIGALRASEDVSHDT